MCCSLSSFGTSSMQTVAAFHLSWAYGQLLERAETYFPDPESRERVVPASGYSFSFRSPRKKRLSTAPHSSARMPELTSQR